MWNFILDELKSLTLERLPSMSPLTIDTLHGSMWGLNHRYTTIEDCLKNDWRRMMDYSIRRIESISGMSNIPCKERILPNFSIGFGTYGWKYDHKIIEEAVILGVSLIDTAEGYGYGRVEEELGKAIKGEKPVVIATKVRRDRMNPKVIQSSANRSFEKLGRSFHFQTHFPCDLYSDEEIGRAFVALRRAGKITSIGLGNCSVDMIESMQRFLSDYSGDVIQSVQVRYSLLDRRIESCLLPYCQERGIVIIAYSPLGQDFKKMDKPILSTIGKRFGAHPSQVALAWILRTPGVIPIPRTNDVKHLRLNMASSDLKLSKEEIEEIEEHYPVSG